MPNRRDWSLDRGVVCHQRNNCCHAAGVIITCASSPRRHAQGHPQEHFPRRQEVDVVILSGTVWDSLGSDCYSLSPRCRVVATAVARGGSTVVVTNTAVAMPAAFLLPTRCGIPRLRDNVGSDSEECVGSDCDYSMGSDCTA